MQVELDPHNWSLTRERVREWAVSNWLVLAGAAWVVGGFVVASQFVVVYNRRAFVTTSAYIALEVVGWTAVSVWLNNYLREREFVDLLGRAHYEVLNGELDDQERTALREFIVRHYDDAGIEPEVVADGGNDETGDDPPGETGGFRFPADRDD